MYCLLIYYITTRILLLKRAGIKIKYISLRDIDIIFYILMPGIGDGIFLLIVLHNLAKVVGLVVRNAKGLINDNELIKSITYS